MQAKYFYSLISRYGTLIYPIQFAGYSAASGLPYDYLVIQDILVERHGPQSKKSRKKSVDVNDVVSLSSSNESEYEGSINNAYVN